MSIEVNVNTEGMRRLAQRSHGILRANLREAAEGIGLGFRAKMVRERLSGRPGLNAVTGQTRASLVHAIRETPETIGVFSGFAGAPSQWVGIQNSGGQIVANGRASKCGKGKLLAIPVGAARTKGGHLRQGPCEYPKDGPNKLFFIKTGNGGVLARLVTKPIPKAKVVKVRKKAVVGPRVRVKRTKLQKLLRNATKFAKRAGKFAAGVKKAVNAKVAGIKRARRRTRELAVLTHVERLARSVEDRSAIAIEVLFVLKPRVYIPARLGFYEAWRDYFPSARTRIVRAVRKTSQMLKNVH